MASLCSRQPLYAEEYPMSLLSYWFRRSGGRRQTSTGLERSPLRFYPSVENLETRVTPAISATFAPGVGVLSVIGDSLDNTITISRDAAGHILVNGGAVPILGGTPTVANTALIDVFG